MAKKTEVRKPTLVAGLKMLEVLVERKQGAGVSEIARFVELDIGQTHRLLSALIDTGYVTQDEERGVYTPTAKIVSLAGNYLRRTDLVELSRPLMRHLVAKTSETVHLAAAVTSLAPVCIARELSPHPVAVATGVGESWPIESSAIGRVVAAFRIPGSQSAVEARGYAMDTEQHLPGVNCVAAPIFDWTGDLVGAIALSGPAYRLSGPRLRELGQLLVSAAGDISAALGQEQPRKKSVPAARI